MSVTDHIILVLSGIAAGFINVVAGGGSLISLPVMIFIGIPPVIANASNRIGLLAQNIFAVSNFHKNKVVSGTIGIYLGISALLGAIIGARLAIDIPEQLFNKILSFVMICVGIMIFFNPKMNHETVERIDGKYKFLSILSFFFIGIYGGFLHAGVGFITMLALVKINRFSLVKTNSIKVLIALIYTTAALFVFILQDVINWHVGLTLAVGSALGGWLGSTFSIKKGDIWIKRLLLFSIVMMAIKLWLL